MAQDYDKTQVMEYDFAIVGLGIYGASLARELSGRGQKVIAFDRFAPPHTEGSSHGHTRIYRRVPFDGSPFVELMGISLEEMHKFEKITGRRFVVETGGLDIGPTDDRLPGADRVENSLKLCRQYNLPHELLDTKELKKRYPLFDLPEGTAAVFQPGSGYMCVEELWNSLLEHAAANGAEIRKNTVVTAIDDNGSNVTINLGNEKIIARQAIIAAGSYLPGLFPEMKKTVKPLRQLVAWFSTPAGALDAARALPIFTLKVEKRWYGFPDVDGKGLKLGWHNVGESAVPAMPGREPEITPEEIKIMRADMVRFMPILKDVEPRVSKCLYAMVDNENFIVDRAPGRENVHIISCCSGHGFKYAMGLSKLISDRLDGGPESPHLKKFTGPHPS